MATQSATPSARQTELLDAAYEYVLEHGLADVSLRPLAAAIGSSPRVLLYLFGSKDGLIRALLARARAEELDLLAGLDEDAPVGSGITSRAEQVWSWLSAPQHRALLTLWVEAYARSLADPDGPWTGFASRTVSDWLRLLAPSPAPVRQDTDEESVEKTLVLAVLRGALLDLLATGDRDRTTAAVKKQLDLLGRTA
jgi:AcrR family transcriptional regulator